MKEQDNSPLVSTWELSQFINQYRMLSRKREASWQRWCATKSDAAYSDFQFDDRMKTACAIRVADIIAEMPAPKETTQTLDAATITKDFF